MVLSCLWLTNEDIFKWTTNNKIEDLSWDIYEYLAFVLLSILLAKLHFYAIKVKKLKFKLFLLKRGKIIKNEEKCG